MHLTMTQTRSTEYLLGATWSKDGRVWRIPVRILDNIQSNQGSYVVEYVFEVAEVGR